MQFDCDFCLPIALFQDLISYIEMRQLDKFYPMTIFRFVTRQTGLVLTLTLSSYDVQADSSSCREVKTKLAVLSRSLRLLIRVCSVYLTNLARALDIEPPAEVVQVAFFFFTIQIFFHLFLNIFHFFANIFAAPEPEPGHRGQSVQPRLQRDRAASAHQHGMQLTGHCFR